MPRTRSQVKAEAKTEPRPSSPDLPTPPDSQDLTAALVTTTTTTTKHKCRPDCTCRACRRRTGHYSRPNVATPTDVSGILAYATAGPFTYDPHSNRYTLDPTFPARHARNMKKKLSLEKDIQLKGGFKLARSNELHPAVTAAFREAERGEGVERVIVFTHGHGSVRVYNGYPEVMEGEEGEYDEDAEWEAEGWEDVGGVKVVKVGNMKETEEMEEVDEMEE